MKLMNILLALVLALFSSVTFAQTININTANAKELESLKGIGPTKASAIVQYREENGPFKSLDDLAKVPGIKSKTLDKLLANNKNRLTVEKAGKTKAAGTPKPSSTADLPKTSGASSKPKKPETSKTSGAPSKPKKPETSKVPDMPKTSGMPKASAELPNKQ